MSLPSITTLVFFASSFWSSTSFFLTAGYTATAEAVLPTSSVLNRDVMFSPFKITCCRLSLYSIIMLTLSQSLLTASSSLTSIPLSRKYTAIALYIAPVSTYINPRFLATRFAIVLFPAPAGPSIAILYIIFFLLFFLIPITLPDTPLTRQFVN